MFNNLNKRKSAYVAGTICGLAAGYIAADIVLAMCIGGVIASKGKAVKILKAGVVLCAAEGFGMLAGEVVGNCVESDINDIADSIDTIKKNFKALKDKSNDEE